MMSDDHHLIEDEETYAEEAAAENDGGENGEHEYEEEEEEEEEEEKLENFLAQALPVADLKHVDLSAPPSTGEEYLSRVRYEASKCPGTVVAKLDINKFKQKQTPQYFQEFNENREEFKAALEWQRDKCAEFSDLRLRIERERNDFLKGFDKKSIKLPNINNRNEWFAFCFGKHRTNSNVKKKETNKSSPSIKMELGEQEQEKEKEQQEHESAAATLVPHQPLLSYLYKLNQAAIIQLFDYHVEWFEEAGVYEKQSFEWMYALMSFLEKPLIPETFASLRNLARTCSKLRAQLTSIDNEALKPLNLFISIVGRYFEQHDLAD